MHKNSARADAVNGNDSILVVDDDEIVRGYLECLLVESGYHVSTAASFDEVRAVSAKMQFRLIISDLVFLGQSYSGLDIVKFTLSLYPDCKAIILTSYPSTHTAVASLRLQAVDYLTKPVGQQELLAAVRRAFDSGHYPKAASSLAEEGISLSSREREVLLYLFKGHPIQDVAGMMGCSLSTVKTYTQRIYKKLNVHSRSAAIHEALRQGFLPQE